MDAGQRLVDEVGPPGGEAQESVRADPERGEGRPVEREVEPDRDRSRDEIVADQGNPSPTGADFHPLEPWPAGLVAVEPCIPEPVRAADSRRYRDPHTWIGRALGVGGVGRQDRRLGGRRRRLEFRDECQVAPAVVADRECPVVMPTHRNLELDRRRRSRNHRSGQAGSREHDGSHRFVRIVAGDMKGALQRPHPPWMKRHAHPDAFSRGQTEGCRSGNEVRAGRR